MLAAYTRWVQYTFWWTWYTPWKVSPHKCLLAHGSSAPLIPTSSAQQISRPTSFPRSRPFLTVVRCSRQCSILSSQIPDLRVDCHFTGRRRENEDPGSNRGSQLLPTEWGKGRSPAHRSRWRLAGRNQRTTAPGESTSPVTWNLTVSCSLILHLICLVLHNRGWICCATG